MNSDIRKTSADFVTAFATGWPEHQPDIMVLSLTTSKGVQDFAVNKEQALLIAKTIRSLRIVGNIGSGILGDPTNGQRQNDVVTYGFSLARAVTERAELVGEVNGRVNLRSEGRCRAAKRGAW